MWQSAVCDISAVYECMLPFSVWLDGNQMSVVLHKLPQLMMKGTSHRERETKSVGGVIVKGVISIGDMTVFVFKIILDPQPLPL